MISARRYLGCRVPRGAAPLLLTEGSMRVSRIGCLASIVILVVLSVIFTVVLNLIV